MFWKRWPYWLKSGIIGGVIGAGVALAVFAANTECESGSYNFPWWVRYLLCSHFLHWEFISQLLILPILPILIRFTSPFGFSSPVWAFILVEIPVIAFWFVVGALIGGIIGYIKSKKKKI